VCTAILLDASEVVALLDSSRILKRIEPACVIFVDIVVIALAVGGILYIVTSAWPEGDDPYDHVQPWDSLENIVIWVMAAVA